MKTTSRGRTHGPNWIKIPPDLRGNVDFLVAEVPEKVSNASTHTNLLSVIEHQDDVSLIEVEQAVFRHCMALYRHTLV